VYYIVDTIASQASDKNPADLPDPPTFTILEASLAHSAKVKTDMPEN